MRALLILLLTSGVRMHLAEAPRCAAELEEQLGRSRDVELSDATAETHIEIASHQLTLRSASGQVLLQRQLGTATECRDVALAARLIIERYVRTIGLTPQPLPPPAPPDAGPPPPPPPPRPRPKPIIDAGEPDAGPPEVPDAGEPVIDVIDAGAPEPEPIVDAGTPEPVDAGPAEPPLHRRFELVAQGGLHVSRPPAVAGVVGLEAALILGNWRPALALHTTSNDTSDIVVDGTLRGRLELQVFDALLSLGYCRSPGPRVCGSVHAGARLTRATATGDFVFQRATVMLFRPSFALEGQVTVLTLRYAVFGLSMTAFVNPVPAEVTIEGAPQATRRVSIVEGQLRLLVGFGQIF